MGTKQITRESIVRAVSDARRRGWRILNTSNGYRAIPPSAFAANRPAAGVWEYPGQFVAFHINGGDYCMTAWLLSDMGTTKPKRIALSKALEYLTKE